MRTEMQTENLDCMREIAEIACAMLAVWHGDRLKALVCLLLASGGSKSAAGELGFVGGNIGSGLIYRKIREKIELSFE